MSTATPGIGRPSVSLTVPVTVADVVVCPRAGTALNTHTIASHKAGDQNFDRMEYASAGGSTRARPHKLKDREM
jgi:hypothetical protein